MSTCSSVKGEASDDSSVVGGGAEERASTVQRQRERRPRMRIYILEAAATGGLWHDALGNQQDAARGHDTAPQVLGLLLGKVTLSPLRSPTSSELQTRMRDLALVQAQRAVVQGFLEYEVEAMLVLLDPMELDSAAMRPGDILDHLGENAGNLVKYYDAGATPSQDLVRDVCEAWKKKFGPLLPATTVALARPVALRVANGTTRNFHCVALTGKLNRKRLLAPDDVSKKRLRTLREQMPAVNVEALALVEKRWTGSEGVRDPAVILEWLDCSSDLKQQHLASSSARKFARLFSMKSGIPAERMLEDLEFCSGRLLIKSRIRADCAANILHRQWWSDMLAEGKDISIHLFCDASPQWRGVELYACTVDIIVDGKLFRRLAPMVSLVKGMLDHNGKLAALLWQMYLLVGATRASLQSFCNCVRSVTTDLGVERLLADSPACISAFFSKVFPGEPSEASEASQMLFPRCVYMPGFRHMIDNIIQKGLNSLRGFPEFLVKLKSMVRFFRNELNVGEVCRCLERDGCHGLAEVLRKASLPSIAEWRWGTLAQVCRSLRGFITSLAERFDPSPFTEQRDQVAVRHVSAALRSSTWGIMFEFVTWYTSRLSDLMDWIGGCECHEAEAKAGRTVSCERKGRRLTEAHAKAQGVLSHMLEEANGWTQEKFGNNSALFDGFQGVVRMTHAYGSEKLGFLGKIPYLLAKLPQAGVKDICLEQFESIEPSEHHRVTRWFLDPTFPSNLRADIDELEADGSNMSARLRAAVGSLSAVPLDDCVCEGPHAKAKRCKMPASSAKWPWVAAALRLPQNLEACRTLPAATKTSLRAVWSSYATVVQPAAKANRFPRMKQQEFRRRLYTVEHLLGFKVPASPALAQLPAVCDGDGFDGEEPAPEGGADAHRSEPLGSMRIAAAGNGSEVADIVARRPDGRLRQGPSGGPERVAEVALMRQWLGAMLQPYDFVTFEAKGDDGERNILAFQLLDLERKSIIVRPFLAAEEQAELEGLYTASVQPLEIFGGTEVVESGAVQTLDTFVFSEPLKIDLIDALGGTGPGGALDLSNRKNILIWQTRLSEEEGCTTLHSPRQLLSKTPDLMSLGVPVLSLVDALRHREFRAVSAPVNHKADTKTWDRRRVAGRRAYLQCVLHMDKIEAKGIKEFSSTGSNAYYEVLLRGKGLVHPGQSAVAYRKQLAIDQGDQAYLDTLALREQKRPLALMPLGAAAPPVHGVAAIADAEDADDESVVGGASPGGAGGSANAENADSDGETSVVAAGEARPGPGQHAELPTEILGMRVRFTPGRTSTTHTYADRIGVRCCNAAHGECGKTRSLALLRDRLGPRCAESFLGAWLSKASAMSPQEHGKYTPTLSEMEQYLASHP